LEGLPLLSVFSDGKDLQDYVGYTEEQADEIGKFIQLFNALTQPKAAEIEKPVAGDTSAATLKLSASKIALLWGQMYATYIEARDSQGRLMSPLPVLHWSSSAATTAYVDAAGRIHALRRGRAVVTAHSGNASASIEVDVSGFSDLAETKTDSICALVDGRQNIYCWERANTPPAKIQTSGLPADTRFASLAMGKSASYALSEANRLYSWRNPHEEIRAVEAGAIPPTAKIGKLAAGAKAACVTASDSQFYCWGWSNALPLPPGEMVAKPNQMNLGEIPPHESLTSVDLGAKGGCVIAGGDTYCWSAGFPPQLVGQGDLPESVKVSSLSAAEDVTCALGDDGRAYCFRLASSRMASWQLVARGEIPSGVRLKQISVNGRVSCAVAGDHRIYCWTPDSQPKRVAKGQIPANVEPLRVACSVGACSVLCDDGKIYAWVVNSAKAAAPILISAPTL
jgi:hypothetical protein